MKYNAYTLRNLDKIEQLSNLDEETIENMKIVAHVLPFKTNNYVVDELINWENPLDDPIFRLNFYHKDTLLPSHFERMKQVLEETNGQTQIKQTADKIRRELNPHPAGQKEYNIPRLSEEMLYGIQHKYKETVLFFPQHGQTCHAYCSFCFRWPQFVNLDNEKFQTKNIEKLIEYLNNNPTVTDILFTGGDPMVMSAKLLEKYIFPLLEAGLPNLKTIRIGSKSLSYWPYRFVSDKDTDQVLELFSEINRSGINTAFMAHLNHHQELQTEVVKEAVHNIQKTGTQIRTQSPILQHINANSDVWIRMWKKQVELRMIPYYMFVVRDTGARHYFDVPLVSAWKIFSKAYRSVSGICRTVRGPSMSCTPGKIEVNGVLEMKNQKLFVLRFIQARDASWVNKPFLAKYDPDAVWIDDLEPVYNSDFFFKEKNDDYYTTQLELEDWTQEAPY